MIVTAIGQWMEANCYSRLTHPPANASLYNGLLWFYRQLFGPWERKPRMLEAYHRARTGPGGDRLDMQGMAAMGSAAAFLDGVERSYAKDLFLIMKSMISGVIQRAAAGEIAVADILPVLERTLFRLTGDNAALASSGAPRRPRSRRRPARR